MNERKKNEWIEKGYASVAKNGFESLSINSTCRIMNKSKSSFYNYFGDLEQFKTELLDYHLEQAYGFAAKVKECKNIIPDLIHIFIDHKTDIFFYKQLRLYSKELYSPKYLEKVFELYENAALDKWSDYFGLNNKRIFAKKFNRFISEHFLMSITPETYVYDWVKNYILEVSDLVRQMRKD